MWEYSPNVGVLPHWGKLLHCGSTPTVGVLPQSCSAVLAVATADVQFVSHSRAFVSNSSLGPPFLPSASGQGLHPGDMAVPRCKQGYEPGEIIVQVKSSLAAGGPLRLMICETKRREGEDVYFKAIGRRQAKGGDIWWGVARPTILETVNRWVERHGSQLITHQGEKAIRTWADQI